MTTHRCDPDLRLVLGSGSPRRRELLAQIGVVPHDIRPPDIDESPRANESPRAYCARIARSKALAIPISDDEIVLCADTTVAVGRRILGKPKDVAQAEDFLRLMSGRRHKVITALVARRGDAIWFKDVVTTVKMKRLSAQELRDYLATEDWNGKAGGYAIQGPAGALIPWIQGSFTGVVGLPLSETATLLRTAGYPLGRQS